MEITKTRFKVKCDFGLCKNNSSYAIRGRRAGLRQEIYICSDCLERLGWEISNLTVPKSPKSAFLRKDAEWVIGKACDTVVEEEPREEVVKKSAKRGRK